MLISELTETNLYQYATSKSFHRGEEYYQRHAVGDIVRRGNCIYSSVQGNERSPYDVSIEFSATSDPAANCNCEYSFGGWCKHAIAVALTCIRNPQLIQKRPALNELLDRLNHVQTQSLVQELVARDPSLIDRIDRFVNKVSPQIITTLDPHNSTIKATVDRQPYRERTQKVMQKYLKYWQEDWGEDPIDRDLPEILDQVRAFIDRGDAHNALVILETVTHACAEDWGEIADYGGDSDRLIECLDPLWATVVLATELSSRQEIDVRVNLENWEDRFVNNFTLCNLALAQGWNAPELLAVLTGEKAYLWPHGRPQCATKLAKIRLEILNFQERYHEYLHLALAEDLIAEYLIMLAQLGRIAEVMAASVRLADASQALAVAKVLKEQDALTEALSIAQTGLNLPPVEADSYEEGVWTIARLGTADWSCYELAEWTSELAGELDDLPAALAAKIIAYKLRPSLASYQQIRMLSGTDWQALQPDLLAHLRTIENWTHGEAKVQIFLHEGAIEDEIATVSDNFTRGHLIQQVMDAATASHPEWVIAKAIPLAEEIIDRGKADCYREAVTWLAKARAAYLKSGQSAQWQQYRTQLIANHGRKRKLMNLMEECRLS